MNTEERQARISRMRRVVEENNIYRWAANFLTEVAGTRTPETGVVRTTLA